jgi:hypothetical protein
MNPCKACLFKVNNNLCDINDINNCCYETLAAFKGNPSINTFRNSPEAKNCIECVNRSIKALGRTPCDLRLTAAPVFVQTPHYFPDLYFRNKDINVSRQQCLEMCNRTRNKNECKINCEIDSIAVSGEGVL